MRGVLHRVRVFGGQFGLLAALALVAALLVTAAPRIANELADRALRQDISQLPYVARDLTFRQRADPPFAEGELPHAAASLDAYRSALAQPLPGLVSEQWFTASVDGYTATPAGPNSHFGLRAQSGLPEAVRVTAGRWPANEARPRHVEVAVSAAVAEQMGAHLGTVLMVGAVPGGTTAGAVVPVEAVVVGFFEPLDPAARAWDDMRLALEPFPGLPPDASPAVIALTDPTGLAAAGGQLNMLTFAWRYRIDERRLDAGMLDAVATAIAETKRTPPDADLSTSMSLDTTLARFEGQLRAVQALLAVVQAGLLATLLGLIGLAAGAAVERRREEFALLRARGASVLTIGGRTLAESLVALPAAALAGWAVGTYAPGRPAATGWLVASVAVIATLAIPVLAAATQRRVTFAARRHDLVRHRPSPRRLTLELFVLVLAVLGAYLLRRRGLSPQAGVDPYLASVPVLLATGAAVVALRIFPWPLRQVGRLAARARGAVAFLGLARAGRGAPVTIGPLAVLVIAIATGVFSSVVTTSIGDARDRASNQEIPADARLTGYGLPPDIADRLAAVPGVTAVTPMIATSGTGVRSPRGLVNQVQVVVVDAPLFTEVIARSGVDVRVPATLTDARRGDEPVPAVVSTELAAEIGTGGTADVRSRSYDFTVGAVAAGFPGVAPGIRRFVVLPWQALPEPAVLTPNQILIAGDGFDPAALRAAAGSTPRPTTVTTWSGHRRGLDRTGANEVLSFTFATGAVGATTLALLAVGFTVLAGARARGRALSRLRTLGMSGRQGRGLLVYELAPLVGIAVLAGGAVGVFLPPLLGPALGLSSFAPGAAVRTYLDPLVVGAVLALVVAALAAAVVIENVINRRMRLGEVLRVGEEMT